MNRPVQKLVDTLEKASPSTGSNLIQSAIRTGIALDGRVCQSSGAISYGGIPEWPKGADCKSVVSDFGGSNPPSPTKNELMKVSSFFLFCSGLENVSDTPVAYQSRSAACVEITLSSFYHKSKNIELPLGWLDIFFLSIFARPSSFGEAHFLFLLRGSAAVPVSAACAAGKLRRTIAAACWQVQRTCQQNQDITRILLCQE